MRTSMIAGVVLGMAFLASLMPEVNGDVKSPEDMGAEYFSLLSPSVKVWRERLPAQNLSDSLLNARIEFRCSYWPSLSSYPGSTSLIAGVSDTFTLCVQFINLGAQNYLFKMESPEQWFAPRLYSPTMDIVHDVPVVDSLDLGYRFRFWDGKLGSRVKLDTVKSLGKSMGESYLMVYDVWDIPQGEWVVTMGKTTQAPNYVHLVYDGCNIQYRPAKDTQDTLNGWIAMANAELEYHSYSEARDRLLNVIAKNPRSVPGWWTLANYYTWTNDSLLTIQAYDSALYFLNNNLDPLMPDSTKQATMIERAYLRAVRSVLQSARDQAPGWW